MSASLDFIETTFPFLMGVNRDMRLTRAGHLLQRVVPQAQPGVLLHALFRPRSIGGGQVDFDTLLAGRRRGVVLDAIDTALVLRGEWYQLEQQDALFFLGWPWLLDLEELASLGLTLSDLPAHNPLGEMLVLLRTNLNTLADTRELAERLQQRSSDLREMNRQLQQLAHYDVLTEIPNRVLLADRLRQAMLGVQRRQGCLAVVYLDLDGFKPVNDEYGHNVGDQMLKVLAQRLKDVLREGDTLARIGGDEFVAVLSDLDTPAECEPILARLLQAASAPVVLEAGVLQVSASAGVTCYPQDDAQADVLLRHADQAMYQAKQLGKNRWHMFDLAYDAAVVTRHESLERIRQGLLHNEFVLHYQPQIDLATGNVFALEALIRWQHPQRGLVPPDQFLPLLEGDPLCLAVGQWVLDTAFAQLAQWQAQGLNVGVSINIDPAQLQSPGFVEQLRGLLLRHPALEPAQITLEVLESCALADLELAESVLRECQAVGFGCALDDFGTGYSSLTYLKRLRADALKIDRSFVLGMLEATDDHAIVQAVISLARVFGRDVIAEGVESAAHAQALQALGCSRAQGYGIARPMPASHVPGWLAQNRTLPSTAAPDS